MSAIHQVLSAQPPTIVGGGGGGSTFVVRTMSVAANLTGRQVRFHGTFVDGAGPSFNTLARRPAMSVAKGLTGRHVYPLANQS